MWACVECRVCVNVLAHIIKFVVFDTTFFIIARAHLCLWPSQQGSWVKALVSFCRLAVSQSGFTKHTSLFNTMLREIDGFLNTLHCDNSTQTLDMTSTTFKKVAIIL